LGLPTLVAVESARIAAARNFHSLVPVSRRCEPVPNQNPVANRNRRLIAAAVKAGFPTNLSTAAAQRITRRTGIWG
jgi:hypothetical protein